MSTVLATTTVEPTTTYDHDSKTIHLTVIVSPPVEGSDQFGIVASPCTVPLGDWTLYWDLVLEGVSAHFESFDLPNSPLASGNVTVTGFQSVTPTQWTAKIQNRVEEVNEFNYTFVVAPDPGELRAALTRHDPTIAVTSDPLG